MTDAVLGQDGAVFIAGGGMVDGPLIKLDADGNFEPRKIPALYHFDCTRIHTR